MILSLFKFVDCPRSTFTCAVTIKLQQVLRKPATVFSNIHDIICNLIFEIHITFVFFNKHTVSRPIVVLLMCIHDGQSRVMMALSRSASMTLQKMDWYGFKQTESFMWHVLLF